MTRVIITTIDELNGMEQMNYKEIERAIANNEPFKHNGTLTGEIDRMSISDNITMRETEAYFSYDDVLFYKIYSYSTLIYAENLQTGEKWLNPHKYSVTTSKQQNIIRRVKNV